jgi:hypothetical protein
MLGSDIGAHGSNKYREKEGINKGLCRFLTKSAARFHHLSLILD